jgi:hypothetical protein
MRRVSGADIPRALRVLQSKFVYLGFALCTHLTSSDRTEP